MDAIAHARAPVPILLNLGSCIPSMVPPMLYEAITEVTRMNQYVTGTVIKELWVTAVLIP